MKKIVVSLISILVLERFTPFGVPVYADKPPLLPEPVIAALAVELSGETAKRNLEYLARQHRMRGSRGFRAAAEYIAEQLRSYGLAEVRIEQFPADGKIFYGTQKSRPAWDADFAELWNLKETRDGWVPDSRLASWEAMPITLAQDSESADVTADLTEVGDGTSEADYAGKDVRGKIVLAAAQPGPVAQLAVDRYGAAGIVSYAQNQRTAWWGEDENLVRWGHLESFTAHPTFAFMVSLKQARDFQRRLRSGERVRLHALVRAGRHPGFYDVVTATLPGADPELRNEEIVYSCHLDHQRPGANDNASGSVTILEVARTFAKLIREGKVSRPARSLRFVWPPEIEGTLALLNARPELVPRIKAVVHMDMVGGGPETKAIFHVTRGPASLPSFIYDVAEAFGEFVNEQSSTFAGTGTASYPLVAPEGGKEALQAALVEFTSGSDHQVYAEGSFGIPAVYLNDWPDRYIHTNADSPANIDPTKLKRAGFIGAATGYFLANLRPADAPALWRVLQTRSLRRTATMLERRSHLPMDEAANLSRYHRWYERAVVDSMNRFIKNPSETGASTKAFFDTLDKLNGRIEPASVPHPEGQIVFRRNQKVKGPLAAFGYDYFTDRYGVERARTIRLLRFRGERGSGGEYAYEVLNFVDGQRTVQNIRDAVSAELGPLPLEIVLEYLRALESIGVVEVRGDTPTLVFTHVTVIDATGAPARPDMAAVITGDRITDLQKTGNIRVPEGAQVIDGTGKFLIPGLWDMHAHPTRDRQIEFLPLLLANGITGVRDMSGDLEVIDVWRREIRLGSIMGPRMVASGPRLDGPNLKAPNSLPIATTVEARQAVNVLKMMGADFIKIYSLIPRDAYFAVADEAKKLSIPFAGHVPIAVTAAEASEAGQRSMEHLWGLLISCSSREADLRVKMRKEVAESGGAAFINAELHAQIESMSTYDAKKAASLFGRFVKNSTWHVPTLAGWRILASADGQVFGGDKRLRFIPREVRGTWESQRLNFLSMLPADQPGSGEALFQRQRGLVRDMRRAGVMFMTGTDTAAPYVFPGFALHDELTLLVHAGLTPMEALQAATRNPAAYLGMLNSLGTVERGKIADLVLLEADPLRDIRNTRSVAAVVVGGKLIAKPDIQRMLADVEARASNP